MLKQLKTLARPLLLGIRRDKRTGHLFYSVDGARVYLRFREEALRGAHRRSWFDNVYFRHYLPTGEDCVVDFGAGLGIEIAMLAARAPGLRYIGVEVQPWVYECLSLTVAQLPPGYEAFGLAVGEEPEVRIEPTRYGIDATTVTGDGAVAVCAISWDRFVDRHRLGRIDLLKINIEGAEADLLDHARLEQVERVVVAVHDWRAEQGEGDHFRTRRRVEAKLSQAGYELRQLPYDWIYAERSRAV